MLVAKELQKHNYCYENYTSVTSKPDSSLWNTTIKDFTPDLDSVIDIIEQGVIDKKSFCTNWLLGMGVSIWSERQKL